MPSLRSFLLFWLCVVHHIVSKEGSIVLVSRVFWYMELKPGQWRPMIWESDLRSEFGKDRTYDGEMDVWGVLEGRTEGPVRIYAAFLVLIVLLMWWDVEDWDGLDIWIIGVWMIGCLLAEGRWWRGRGVGAGVGRRGNSVWRMTWSCLVCILSGLFSRICGGTWFGANV